MRSRAASRLAWGVWVVCVTLMALCILFASLNGFATGYAPYLPVTLSSALSFSTVGALIASRRHANPIGWLLCAAGLSWALTALGGEYGYAFTTGARPGGVFGLWLGSWIWLVAGSVVLFSFMYFPDGRLPSPRWRVAAWIYALAVCGAVVPIAFGPGPLLDTEALGLRRVANPFGVEAAGFLDFGAVITLPLAPVAGLPVLVLVVRYLRATGEERQQIKWPTPSPCSPASSPPRQSGPAWTARPQDTCSSSSVTRQFPPPSGSRSCATASTT